MYKVHIRYNGEYESFSDPLATGYDLDHWLQGNYPHRLFEYSDIVFNEDYPVVTVTNKKDTELRATLTLWTNTKEGIFIPCTMLKAKKLVKKIKEPKDVYIVTIDCKNTHSTFGVFTSPKKAWKNLRKIYCEKYDMAGLKLSMKDGVITYQPSDSGFTIGYREMTVTLSEHPLNINWVDYITGD